MLTQNKFISLEWSESDFRSRNRDLALLLDISGLLPLSGDLKDPLAKSLAKVIAHFELDAGRIYLMDEAGQCLRLEVCIGVETAGLEKVRLTEGFSGRSARTRSFIAQHVSELEDRERSRMLAEKGFVIVICVPLIALDKVIGVMNLAGKRVRGLTQETVDLLSAIGNQIALVVSNLHLFQEVLGKAKEIEEKTETVKFFTYSFMHDLKGPALAVHGLANRLRSRYSAGLDEKGKACLDQILKASGQLQVLMEHLNEYIHARAAPMNVETVSLEDLAEEIRDEFSERLSARGVRLMAPELTGSVRADRVSLLRAVRNLVDNALKYGGEGLREIRIGQRKTEGFRIVSVSDDGVGIRQEAVKDLFKPFHRHETSKGTQGSGLGLAIVKEIAERHHGRAWTEGNGPKGITFCFSIAETGGETGNPPSVTDKQKSAPDQGGS